MKSCAAKHYPDRSALLAQQGTITPERLGHPSTRRSRVEGAWAAEEALKCGLIRDGEARAAEHGSMCPILLAKKRAILRD